MANYYSNLLYGGKNSDTGVPWAGLNMLAQQQPPGTIDLMAVAQGQQIGSDLRESRERREEMRDIREKAYIDRQRQNEIRDDMFRASEYITPLLNNAQRANMAGVNTVRFFKDQLQTMYNDIEGFGRLSPRAQMMAQNQISKTIRSMAINYEKQGRVEEARQLLEMVGYPGHEYGGMRSRGDVDSMISKAITESGGQIKYASVDGEVDKNNMLIGDITVPSNVVAAWIEQDNGSHNLRWRALQYKEQQGQQTSTTSTSDTTDSTSTGDNANKNVASTARYMDIKTPVGIVQEGETPDYNWYARNVARQENINEGLINAGRTASEDLSEYMGIPTITKREYDQIGKTVGEKTQELWNYNYNMAVENANKLTLAKKELAGLASSNFPYDVQRRDDLAAFINMYSDRKNRAIINLENIKGRKI